MDLDQRTTLTQEEAEDLYGVGGWGDGYFGVDEDGSVVVRPHGLQQNASVSLSTLVADMKERGIEMPVLLRFVDVLSSRIARINDSFKRAMQEAGYQGAYRGVYPIKVNQQQQVVQEIAKFGLPYHYGLEAGSKAELVAAMAYMRDPEALLVCNGYKDEEFIDLTLCAQKMGFQPILVVEMPGELPLILERAKALGVRPRLGVRAKLSAQAGGLWNSSGGDHSSFGLNASQIIDVVDRLRAEGYLDCLCMLHFHLGSQIPGIRSIRQAVWEASRFYTDLVKEGAPMGYLDIGGGLAVDYDGSHTDSPSSCNYHLDEYAADVVEAALDAANEGGVPHPTLVTEAGRATVAHHSVLLFNILDVTLLGLPGMPDPVPDDAHELIRNLVGVNDAVKKNNLQECYHDAVHYRDDVRDLFEHGDLSLRERATAERIFWHIVSRIARDIQGQKHVPEELKGLDTALADVYHGNFSVFQSLPDSWAIKQLFPVMPVHRLREMPTRQATLSDITCDSDGRINRFIDFHTGQRTMPVHELNGEEYYLGVFLVGAYQETLGDLHNLLGDTNVVAVRIDEDGMIEYDREIAGDTVADVLSYVEYEPQTMIEKVRQTAERAVRAGRISAGERRAIMAAYEDGLRGYTYFEN